MLIDYLRGLPEELPALEKLELFLQWHFLGSLRKTPPPERILLRERSNLINLPRDPRRYMEVL